MDQARMDAVSLQVGPVTVDLIGDDRICQHVKAGRSFEPETLEAWAQMCAAGSEVIDVGCYSGLFAIAAAKLGCRPIGIEPLPQMRKRIAENSKLNDVHFKVIGAAASDHAGTARIGFNAGVHLTSGASLLRKSGAGIDVKTITLDGLKVEHLAAIKIDVERLEAAVLRGGLRMIERHRPKLIVEFLDAEAKAAIIGLLPSYRVEAVTDVRNLILFPR